MNTTYTERPTRRKTSPHTRTSKARPFSTVITDTASQLTVGGRLVHRRTHRCVAFCNMVAALAGIGLEAR
jgi:hypothetical protein